MQFNIEEDDKPISNFPFYLLFYSMSTVEMGCFRKITTNKKGNSTELPFNDVFI